MATTLQTIHDRARITLLETTASFWTDAELLAHIIAGAKDLWKAVLDLHQEHFLTIDATNVTLAANSNSLAGVPTGVFRVHTLELRDLTSANSVQDVDFQSKEWNHPDFVAARGLTAQSPNGLTIYFCVIDAGAPVAAPTIKTAPQITAALNLTLAYIPVLSLSALGDTNPIPGESDHALYAWCVAYAKAKERSDGTPDPEWLSVYATEKKNLLAVLTPRQEQDEEYAEGMFAEYYGS